MSIPHTNAVMECDQFKGNTRLLLMALAYYAYDKGPFPKGFPDPGFGWLYRDEAFFMDCLNITRRQTISGYYSELTQAGAIRRKRRWHNSWLTFVDLEWLKNHARPQVTENVTSVAPSPTESVTSVATESVTYAQRKAGHVDNGKRDNKYFFGVQRSSASSSSSSKSDENTLTAPQVLPQAETTSNPFDVGDVQDGLSISAQSSGESRSLQVPPALSQIVPTRPLHSYDNPCPDVNCRDTRCYSRRCKDRRDAYKRKQALAAPMPVPELVEFTLAAGEEL